jgi:hypothetical protein
MSILEMMVLLQEHVTRSHLLCNLRTLFDFD